MSASATRQHLEAAIRANKRGLALLDKQIAETSEISADLLSMTQDVDQCQPFSYVTQDGIDHAAGINLGDLSQRNSDGTIQGGRQPFYGFFRTDSDSAFVLERLFASVRVRANWQGTGSPADAFVDAATANKLSGFGLRLYDVSNAHALTLSNDTLQQPQDAIVPVTLFGPSFFSSLGGLELPAECTFPRNATIRVEAFFTTAFTATNVRLSLIWQGYKVFGG